MYAISIHYFYFLYIITYMNYILKIKWEINIFEEDLNFNLE